MFDEKAQLHTLEGVAAAVIILLVIIYAIDATSMTPLTASTASVHVETELRALGQDILNTLDYAEPGHTSKLKNDILAWNGSVYTWSGSNYTVRIGTDNLNNNLTEIFRDTLVEQGIAHSVELTFIDNSTLIPYTVNMIYNGDPSNNAVVVSRKFILQNIGPIDGEDRPEGDSIDTHNPIKDIDPSTNLYNIVDIRLILWRM
ncbi:hypothetical protein ANME2D_01820 [Candidatus Methanoperedens nitroreducens]|uniref:Uncharacterized protein n=1 Tax=Candidatus Methanoperedens nitratireducens TaxID=1392998 RepID=A0A062V8R8_9EURY|nr:hypothetical protein [Candidatus Methanoperedens nitroreducens]KCZ71765.1 hypothetical protein ANME2D_01820 [Candidatus Methanoperedens nitroreducens]MDJ1422262.1 hypothetical protein [Candidatus Methanoperedens sp.]